MPTFLWVCTGVSLLALLIATLAERSAIVGRINGANGMIILVFLIVSFLASILVAIVSGIFGGWSMFWRVLGGGVLYHAVMGAATIGYLQWFATRSAAEFKAEQAARDLAYKLRIGKKAD